MQVDSKVGATTLVQSELWFDDFGRRWKERRKMPGGTWSERETLRNERGWTTSVSEWGNLTKKTEFLSFDAFGRATIIRPPDGTTHDLKLTLDGIRKVKSEAKINLAAGETYVPTMREYDAYGRLREVLENSGGTATDTPTTYEYDVLKRMTKLTSGTVALGGVQTREFTYDNRGFMLKEKHPEKGSSGGGWVYNYDFDSVGRVHRNLDGPQ